MLTWAYVAAWARAFAFTQIVEAPIYRWGFGARWRTALGASALTHPFVWFAFPWLQHALGVRYRVWVTFAELFALFVEAALLVRAERMTPRRALLASLAANGTSFGLGLVANAWFDGI